jgi:hypothetical protein
MNEFLEEHKLYVKDVLERYSLPFAFVDSSLYWCEETSMGFKVGLSVKINEKCPEYQTFKGDFNLQVFRGFWRLEDSLAYVDIRIPEAYRYISNYRGDIFFEADTLKKYGKEDLGMYLAYLSKIGFEALSGANDRFSLKWGLRSKLHMDKLIQRGILQDLSLLYRAGSLNEKEANKGESILVNKYFSSDSFPLLNSLN